MRKLSILVLAGSLLQSATPLALVATAQEIPQPAVSATQASLTNRDILEMSKSGLSADIIVAKIKASPGAKFDTSPVALQELKAANIPESVILAMLGSEMPALAAVPPMANMPVAMTEVAIDDGTPIEVELLSTVSGQQAKVGDVVDFKVLQPIIVKGAVIIEKDAAVKARITTAKQSGYWGKAGKLEWAVQDVVVVDGSRLPVRFKQHTSGDSKGGTVAVGAIATTVFLGPVGLLWGLKKGKAAIIPAGNRYTVFVDGNRKAMGKMVATQAKN